MLIFLLISWYFTKKSMYENSVNYSYQIIKQVNYDINYYIGYMMNISSIVSKSSDVLQYLYNEDQTEEEIKKEHDRILSQFATIRGSRNDIYNIAAVAKNGHRILNDGTDKFTGYIDIEDESWYKAALSSVEGVSISSSHVQNAIQESYQWVITLSRPLVNYKTKKKDGVFFVDLNYSAISKLCNNNSLGDKGYIFILDKDGKIVYHPKQDLIYGGILSENTKQIMKNKSNSFLSEDGSKLYTVSRSDLTGWTTVGVIYTQELMKNNKQTQILYLLIAMILLLGVTVMSDVISGEITKPIRQLHDSMNLVEEGCFDEANIDVTTDNEVGNLSESFNIMAERIHALMEQNVYEQKQKRKSELKALQAQINPHFLYNTLDSIIWMSEGGKNDEVVLMTSALAKLLRQSISNDKEEVSIAEEINYVKSYMLIQKMRYADKLDYSIKIAPEIESTRIVKLTLQPIVENAIYHGLKYKKTKGNISIEGSKLGENACITISDDGVGMETETLDRIFKKREQTKSNGVGVYNVQKRLKLNYGEEYGISYLSRKGVGTMATITLPIADKKNDKKYDK